MAIERLNQKQRVFVEEYLQCWNATEAARRANYAFPRRQGSRLLSHVDIKAEIEKRISEKAMAADEVLGHLADIARFDAGLLFGKGGVIDWDQAKERGYTLFVKKLQWTSDGLKVEMYDRLEALEKLGDRLSLWKDPERDNEYTLHVVYDDD